MINNPVGADLRACSAHMNENTGSPLQKDLPEGWFWKTMGEISDVIGGGTPRTNVLEYYNDGNIPWITPADLSEYNILNYNSKPYFIDFSQSTSIKNPQARELMSRDVDNLVRFANKYKLTLDRDKILDDILGINF